MDSESRQEIIVFAYWRCVIPANSVIHRELRGDLPGVLGEDVAYTRVKIDTGITQLPPGRIGKPDQHTRERISAHPDAGSSVHTAARVPGCLLIKVNVVFRPVRVHPGVIEGSSETKSMLPDLFIH